MANDWKAGLTDQDELSQYPSAANPLSAMGLDPDEVAAKPDLLAKVSGNGNKPSTPSIPPLIARPKESPSAATAGAVGGAGDTQAPSSPQTPPPSAPEKLEGYGEEGLGLLKKQLQGATDETAAMSTAPPADVSRLSALEAQQSQKTPARDAKGNLLPDYKPTTGQKIWRGVRGGLVGLATGGIPGAAVGALEPQDIRGGVGYSAPNKAYQRAEDTRLQQLGSTQQQLKTAMQTWKDVNDARKAKAAEFRSAATVGSDVLKGVAELQKNSVDKFKAEATAENYKDKADEANQRLAEQASKDYQNAQSTEQKLAILQATAQMRDQIQQDQIALAQQKLTTTTDTKTLDADEKADIDALNKDYTGVIGSIWNRVMSGSKEARIAQVHKMYQDKRQALGLLPGGNPPGAKTPPNQAPKIPPGMTHVVPGPDGRNHYTNAAGTVDGGIAP